MGSPRNGQSKGMRRQRGRKEGRPRGGVRGLRGCKRVGRASGAGEPVSPQGLPTALLREDPRAGVRDKESGETG